MTECAPCTDFHCQNLLATNNSRVVKDTLQGFFYFSGLGEGLLVLNWTGNQIEFCGERSGAVSKKHHKTAVF